MGGSIRSAFARFGIARQLLAVAPLIAATMTREGRHDAQRVHAGRTFDLCPLTFDFEMAPRAGLGPASNERSELLRDPEDSNQQPSG